VAAAFDASSTQTASGGAFPITWTHTPVGTPTAVMVVFENFNATVAATGVTYGGVALTQFQNLAPMGSGGTGMEMWGVANPPSGAQTVSINGPAGAVFLVAGAVTVTGSDTTTCFRNTLGQIIVSGVSVSGTVSSVVSGDLAVDAVCNSFSATQSPNAGQTVAFGDTSVSNLHIEGSYLAVSSTSVTMAWTATGSNPGSQLAQAIGVFKQASAAVAETNTHFIGRFTPSVSRSLLSLRQNVAADFSTAQVQPETNTHFIGKLIAPIFTLLPSLRQNASLDITVTQPETNTHFIGRFVSPYYARLPLLRQNIAADFSTAQTQPETNTHFIGKFTPWQSKVLLSLRQSPNTDFVVTVVTETNVNWLGRFSVAPFNLLPGLRQNIAADFSSGVQAETNPNFIGRFTSARHTLLQSLRQSINTDFIAPIVFETNTNFIGRFTQRPLYLLPLLRQNVAADFSSTPTFVELPHHPTPFGATVNFGRMGHG
jgi:hypothetical protein